jgi:ABC-type phosphate/phosphonate transport system substrate-binding protein
MISYIATTALLKKAGLDSNDYQISFAKNPPFAIIDAFMNKGDAAASGAHLLNTASVKKCIGNKGIKAMHILAVGDPLTHLPWAVKSNMPPTQRETFKTSMTSLKATAAGRAILKAAMVSDFF